MSVNKHNAHVLVLPEDDANRQLATGFLLDQSVVTRSIQVLPEVGGWLQVLESFRSEHARSMDRYPKRLMLLLIDFDGKESRLQDAKDRIPGHLSDRVFILGVLTEPERLKPDFGSFESIGLAMAKDCRENSFATWGHDLLRHNANELARLSNLVRPWLFSNQS